MYLQTTLKTSNLLNTNTGFTKDIKPRVMTNSSNLLQKAVEGLLRKMVLTFSLCYLTPIVSVNGIKLTYSAKTTFPYGPLILGPFGWVSAVGRG